MAVASAVEQDSDHGEVGGVVVLVVPLLGGPSENVEAEIRVRLGFQGLVHFERPEPRFELLDPRLELLFKWGSGSERVRGDRVFCG